MKTPFQKTLIAILVLASISAQAAHAEGGKVVNPFGSEKADEPSIKAAKPVSKEVNAETMPPAPNAAADAGENYSQPPVHRTTKEEVNPKFNPVETLINSRLTPEEILQIRKVIQDENLAKEVPLAGRATPAIRTIKIDLSPDATPPILRISKGAGATIVFTRSGQQVEIEQYVNFAKKQISVNEFGVGILAISALADEQHNAAFAVRLKDIPVPVQFTVLTGQPMSDYRIDAYLPSLSASGKSSLSISQEESNLSTAMMFAMSNIVPDGYTKGVASAGQVFLDKAGEQMLYRIHGTLISPAMPESSRLESPDGMKVYALPATGILSVLIDGKISTVKIEGI